MQILLDVQERAGDHAGVVAEQQATDRGDRRDAGQQPAVLLLGAMLRALISGYLANRISRK